MFASLQRKGSHDGAASRSKPQVEILEGRDLPSTLGVESLPMDSISLNEALAASRYTFTDILVSSLTVNKASPQLML